MQLLVHRPLLLGACGALGGELGERPGAGILEHLGTGGRGEDGAELLLDLRLPTPDPLGENLLRRPERGVLLRVRRRQPGPTEHPAQRRSRGHPDSRSRHRGELHRDHRTGAA